MKGACRLGFTIISAYFPIAGHARGAYGLDTTYDASNFFSNFDFFTEPDPTHGYVRYVDRETAFRDGIASDSGGAVFLGVDHRTYNPLGGRKSVRLTSQKSFTHGLVVADINHMPGAICGVWPAFWMFGPSWPSFGEIDIIEGVNDQDSNTITLHTSPGCFMTLSGENNNTKSTRKDCSVVGAGCGMQTRGDGNYGDAFNSIKGGVYAMDWTSERIAVWFFPRDSIPDDVASRSPDPTAWGEPLAQFSGGDGCSIDSHFKTNNIVIDTTFCGDWAGSPSVWDSNLRCSASGRSCVQYVATNPLDFVGADWLINSVMVYKRTENHRPGDQFRSSNLVSTPQSTSTPPASRHKSISVSKPKRTLIGR